jgi:8-oxo-dGTP pyrophosphatase MutT (NUDIX family)
MSKNGQVPAEPDREPSSQSGALPWRRNGQGELEVLLITSRETRRWIIPKGWRIKGLSAQQTAAREAFEEAGVKGEVGKAKVGVFHYDKRLRSGRMQSVRVTVYPLKVDSEREAWPEVQERAKLWAPITAAADLVQEPELASLLRTFSPD